MIRLVREAMSSAAPCTQVDIARRLSLRALSSAQMRVMSIVIERAFPPQCVEAFEHSEWRVTQSTTTKNASPVGG